MKKVPYDVIQKIEKLDKKGLKSYLDIFSFKNTKINLKCSKLYDTFY